MAKVATGISKAVWKTGGHELDITAQVTFTVEADGEDGRTARVSSIDCKSVPARASFFIEAKVESEKMHGTNILFEPDPKLEAGTSLGQVECVGDLMETVQCIMQTVLAGLEWKFVLYI